jgi:GNAT superfamily N-acetyltransferase
MLAVRAARPFSLDQKLPDLDSYLPPGRRVCELRLLAIAKPHRSGRVLQRLFEALWQHALHEGLDVAIISGTTRQLKMYRRLGFVPFGPLVGSPGAEFQPMIITREAAAARLGAMARTRHITGHRAEGKGQNDAKGKASR